MSVAHIRKLEWWEEETPMAFPAPKRLLSEDDLQTLEKTGIVPPGRRFELIQGEVYERDRNGLHKHLFGVDEYQRMEKVGILADDERIELIRGEIYLMSPIGDPHGLCLMWLDKLLEPLRPGIISSMQGPLRLRTQMSMPQPDLFLTRYDGQRPTSLPNPEDVLLLIEVSDTTLRRDRKKMVLYGASGIPESLLVNLRAETVSVYRKPCPAGYEEVRTFRRGESFSLLAFPDFSLSVDRIFG